MSRKVIQPSPKAKLLGVIFDQELRWKEYVQQAIKRATEVIMALSGLRHLRPGQMRQVYQACVTLVADYVSTVWHNPLRDKTHLCHLNTVQRTALIHILSAFRTVATTTLEDRGLRPSHSPSSPTSSPEHHCKAPHSTSRPPYLECTITSPKREE